MIAVDGTQREDLYEVHSTRVFAVVSVTQPCTTVTRELHSARTTRHTQGHRTPFPSGLRGVACETRGVCGVWKILKVRPSESDSGAL